MDLIMKELHQIRYDLHQKIFDCVKNYNKGKIRVIREANQLENQCAAEGKTRRTGKHPACKVILTVESMSEAQDLVGLCEMYINNANNTISEKLNKKGLDRYVIKYKISIIEPNGDIQLSTKRAETRRLLSVSGIQKEVNKRLRECIDIDAIKSANECIRKLDPLSKYIFAVETGTSYRCTYYDVHDNKRKQVSVGNILIAVNSTAEILNAPERKQRADCKERIAGIFTENAGIISIYPE